MIEAKKYDTQFFDDLEANSYASAKGVLPIVKELVQPQSVIDIGCGSGMWLKVWSEELGISDFFGVEGPYVKPEQMKVPISHIQFKDLKEPLDMGRRYDLCMSVEVAEHLPESSARQFIQTLVSLSDVVFFSAAIPGQGGTYHINEQYPEYWAALFRELGYVAVDILRPRIWKKRDIEFWYQQNVMIYVKETALPRYPKLETAAGLTDPAYLTRIHPELLDRKTEHILRTDSMWGFLNNKWYLFKTKYLKKK